jgi:hypothetical protein
VAAWLLLALLPVLVNAPTLSRRFNWDPVFVVSGLTQGTWTTNGLIPGMPWVDGNAGVTTQALGGLVARDWLHGRLPWWNPYSGVGLPLAAEGQNAALFLPFVLLLALPHGLLVLRIVLMILSGWFAFALLRRLRLGPEASLVGAALFELNGIFAWMAHGPMMPVAFLPLMLLGLEVARSRFSMALALGVTWTLVAGFPETAFLNGLFAVVWGAVRLVRAPDRLGYARHAGLSVLSGMLLAAPSVWPFLQSLPQEYVGIHQGVIHSGFLPANLSMLLFPGIFGAPMAGPMALGADSAVWVRAGGYCDIALVALALMGLRPRAPDGAMRMAVAGWIAVTGARAAAIPAFVWAFSLVPFLRQANLHVYVLPSWSMGACVLAAQGLQDWRDGARLPWRRVAAAAAAVTSLAMVHAAPDVAGLWSVLDGYRALLAISLVVPCLTVLLVLLAMRRVWSRGRYAMLAGAVGVNAALLFVVPQFAGTHGRRVDTDAVRFLRDNSALTRVWSLGPLVPNYGAWIGVAEIGHNYLPVPRLWVEYVGTRLMGGGDGVNFFPGWPPDAAKLAAMLPAYEAAGVGLVTVPPGLRPFGGIAPAPVRVFQSQAMDIWQLPAAAPYWQAESCTLAPASREDVVATCLHGSTLRRLELDWPGWSARIGARPVPISRGDDVFQQIDLPAGISVVRFSYAPPWIDYAWGCCLAGVVIIMAHFGKILGGMKRGSTLSRDDPPALI